MIERLYEIYKQHPHIQTDTRKLKAGEIFFALKGPNFNGNLFAQQALEIGASAVIVDEPTNIEDQRLFHTKDALVALQQLALHHRKQFNIPLLAITGSNGKTTTKELIHAVLTSKYRTSTTIGNLNNHIGIPLTLLSIPFDAEMAIIEMGANHQLEIESYCTYTQPTHGLITNCGKAHLEGFGGVQGVKKGKGELFDYLRKTNGTAFVLWDYDYFHTMSEGIKKIITYGTKDASITGKPVKSEPFLEISLHIAAENINIQSQLVGDYNLPNILAAAAIGNYFDISPEKIKKAIETYIPTNSRSQLVTKGTNKIILDAYNANPTSMKAAIENFAGLLENNKYILLGGMMELGIDSKKEHQEIVALLQRYKWKEVVLVGGDFASIQHPYLFFKTADEAKVWLSESKIENGYFLIKGSRSMKMEITLDAV
jgi:UDP-N-acetylmuramoyl-tripeptide--D-alanyl-D-alanine ligase